MEIGKRIQKYRKLAGLTQKELAEKLGVVTGTVQQYELGKRHPRLDQLQRIANALGVEVHELYSDKQEDRDYISRVVQMTEQNANDAVDRSFVERWNSSELTQKVKDNIDYIREKCVDQVGKIDKEYEKRFEEFVINGYKLGYMAAQGLKPQNVDTLIAVGVDERYADLILHFSNYPYEEQEILLNEMKRIHKQKLKENAED